jgi:hypothetical protein
MIIIDSQVHAYEANTPKRPWHAVPNWPDHVTGDEMVAGGAELITLALSFRDVEDLLAERGITVSYETVRRWVNHFGSAIAADLRKRRPRPHSTWHLDEVYIKIDGRLVYLWRAVDAEGEVLGGTREEGCRRDTACGTSDKILVVLVASPCATGCSGRPGCSGGTAHSGRPSGSRVTRGTHCAGRTRSAGRASCSGRAGGPVEPVAPVLPVAPRAGRSGILLDILRRIGLTGGGAVELGVGDGLENNSLILLMLGWKILWVGGEELRISLPGNCKNLRFAKEWVTRENCVQIVSSNLALWAWTAPT